MTFVDTLDQGQVETALADMRRTHPDSPLRGYARGDDRFWLWLVLVNRRLLRRLGVSLLDLVDCTWRDWYDDGLKPSEAIDAARGYDDLLEDALGGGPS